MRVTELTLKFLTQPAPAFEAKRAETDRCTLCTLSDFPPEVSVKLSVSGSGSVTSGSGRAGLITAFFLKLLSDHWQKQWISARVLPLEPCGSLGSLRLGCFNNRCILLPGSG